MENQDDAEKQAKVPDSAYCLENQDNSEKHAKVSGSAYCLENQDDSEKHAQVSNSAYCLENQDNSVKHSKVSDSAYCLENQDNSEKNAQVSDSAYCLENQDNSVKHSKVSESAYCLENQDNSEKHSKVSDSAYSNSCSNSQSRKSHSSKSTRSGSNSSGSSGYGEKQTSSSSKNVPTSTTSRKRALEKPALLECKPPEPIPLNEAQENQNGTDTTPLTPMPEGAEDSTTEPLDQNPNNDEIPVVQTPTIEDEMINSSEIEGFSCAISLHDGIVMYTTKSLSVNLGFPEGMWIGRSFIEFVHPRDRNVFTTQITKCLPLTKIVNSGGTQQQERVVQADQECSMACRIRRYRNASEGFVVTTHRPVFYVPFVLKLTFKEIKEDSGSVVYLILKADPLLSAYKSPNEVLLNPVPFVIRHAASGALEHIDVESVSYLGYMPHDIHNKDALTMYHPDDLPALKVVYDTIVKKGELAKSMPFRMRTQNGDYVKVKTEWTSFTNPWSMKLEFIIGKHTVVEGPATPNVFKVPSPPPNQSAKMWAETKQKTDAANSLMEDIQKILNDVAKPADPVKEHVSKRVHDIATVMERILEIPKPTEDLRVDTQEGENEQDTELLGGISPHHEYKDSTSSGTTSSYSYNQLNYNENLQRYFDSHQDLSYGSSSPPLLVAGDSASSLQDQQRRDQQCPTQTPQNSFHYSDGPSSSMTYGTRAKPTFCPPARLTHSLLLLHNNKMEKELAKTHREGRSSYKTKRTSENRQQNKKAHLARCNASFKPTQAVARKNTITLNSLKRTLENIESDIPAKQSCPQKDAYNHAQPQALPERNNAIQQPLCPPAVVPVSSHVEKLTSNTVTDTSQNGYNPQNNQQNVHPPCLPPSYQSPLYGQVSLYPEKPLPTPAPHNQPMRAQYEQDPYSRPDYRRATPMDVSEEMPSTSFKITESMLKPGPPKPVVVKEVVKRSGLSDEELYRTDGESTYSSFYSLSLKTASGSISSNDQAKAGGELPKKDIIPKASALQRTPIKFNRPGQKLGTMAPDLFNQYQVPQRSHVETMNDHIEKMRQLSSQPALVNDQLVQLYRDCETLGINCRLTLEEGFTTSSSSGDDGPKTRGNPRRREYSKLNMIYEENAPLPPPSPCPQVGLSGTLSEECSSGDPDFTID